MLDFCRAVWRQASGVEVESRGRIPGGRAVISVSRLQANVGIRVGYTSFPILHREAMRATRDVGRTTGNWRLGLLYRRLEDEGARAKGAKRNVLLNPLNQTTRKYCLVPLSSFSFSFAENGELGEFEKAR